MEKISWLDKVTNEEVLRRVNKERLILNSFWQRKHRLIGHILRHDRLLHKIIEGRMRGKPTMWRRRIQMLYDLANDGGYVALKGAGEYREGWRHREKMLQQKTADDDDYVSAVNQDWRQYCCYVVVQCPCNSSR